jgi:hypothetical protein
MNKFIQNYVKKEKKIIPVLKLYGMHDASHDMVTSKLEMCEGRGVFFYYLKE